LVKKFVQSLAWYVDEEGSQALVQGGHSLTMVVAASTAQAETQQ
jgi:hypothetical protein